jgi:hypothetical protein
MNYEDFENSFTKANRKLRIALALTMTVAVIAIVLQFLERRYYLYRGGAIFEERPLAEEICRTGFLSLAEGLPNPHLVHGQLIKIASQDNFSIPVEKVLQVQSLEKEACKIVFKSEGTLTSFKIILQGSHTNPFYYKLIQVDELAAKEKI